MDFRPTNVIRAERFASRLQSAMPRAFSSRFTQDSIRARNASRNIREFARFADLFANELYERLLRTYGDHAFSRILALKLTNLAIAKYHFVHRHVELLSRAVQLTVDPANACQLACPGCIHSENKAYSSQFDWPRNTLGIDVYTEFMERLGPFAFCVMLYNYGEPLLHKRFSELVRIAKKYLLFTMCSTNLSMPLNDPDSLVASGLDRMVLSIDGTTQNAYARYRRNGQLDLVYANIRKIVDAKRRLRSDTPYLIWQFLTFAHNAHQTRDAIQKARALGVNELLISTPFSVAIDDPTIQAVRAKDRGRYVFSPWHGNWCTPAYRAAASELPVMSRIFEWSWEQQSLELNDTGEKPAAGGSTCDWLYTNLTLDGAARLMPCCMAPDKQEKNLVFGHFPDAAANPANSRMGVLARLSFARRSEYEASVRASEAAQPYCAGCVEKPVSYGLANVSGDIRVLDSQGVLPRSLRWELTNWT